MRKWDARKDKKAPSRKPSEILFKCSPLYIELAQCRAADMELVERLKGWALCRDQDTRRMPMGPIETLGTLVKMVVENVGVLPIFNDVDNLLTELTEVEQQSRLKKVVQREEGYWALDDITYKGECSGHS